VELRQLMIITGLLWEAHDCLRHTEVKDAKLSMGVKHGASNPYRLKPKLSFR